MLRYRKYAHSIVMPETSGIAFAEAWFTHQQIEVERASKENYTTPVDSILNHCDTFPEPFSLSSHL